MTLAHVVQLVDETREAEAAVEAAEEKLRLAKERHRELVERRLPEAMDAVGLTRLDSRGVTVVVRDEVQVKQPPVHQRGAAHQWLRENGQGGLVRNTVEVDFAAGQEERARALLDHLELSHPGSVRRVEEVNSTSLAAFLRRALNDGASPPLELFGARAFRAAKFK
jgi:hypothetical protein